MSLPVIHSWKKAISAVPQKQATDIIDGRNYLFVGDTDLVADDFTRNFHIKPSRVLNRIEFGLNFKNSFQYKNLVQYNGIKILILDETTSYTPVSEKLILDLLIVSGNPKLYFKKLAENIFC